jgi:hypothetical protein
MSKKTVSFTCESVDESDVIRNAVNRFRWVLQERGIDLRNYARPAPGYAGFGWDAVQRAARDMSNGSVTYMSDRMARAFLAALLDKAEKTTSADARRIANGVASRFTAAVRSVEG